MKYPITYSVRNGISMYYTSWTSYSRSNKEYTGYDKCNIRKYLLSEVLPGFSSDVQSAMATMQLAGSTYNADRDTTTNIWLPITLNDKIKIPSLSELGFSTDIYNGAYSYIKDMIDDGHLYPIFGSGTGLRYNINAYISYSDNDEYLSSQSRYRGYYTRSRYGTGSTAQVWDIIMIIATYNGDDHTINGVTKGAFPAEKDAFDDAASKGGCVAIIRFGKQ